MSAAAGAGPQQAEAPADDALRRLARLMLRLAIWLGVLAAGLYPFVRVDWIGITFHAAAYEDIPAAAGLAVALLVLAVALPRGPALARVPELAGWQVWAAAAAVLAAALAGAFLIEGGFALSRDEWILLDGARLFASGRLAAPVAPEWQPFLNALHPAYVRVSADRSLISSGYYPGSEAIYALFEWLGSGKLANPALAAGAVLLTAAVGRRIFPDRPGAAVLAALLLAGSPQVLVTAMTPFAMTDHLFLALAWLALYLRDSRAGHGAAMLVGAVATAQHQMHIHLIFVLPFLADLALRQRRWGLACAYALVYGLTVAACLGWRGYVLEGPVLNLMRGRVEASGLEAIWLRLVGPLGLMDPFTVSVLWMANLLRLAVWQNPLTLVLVFVGLGVLRGAPRPLQLLAIGIPLALAPNLAAGVHDQGYGWGFRYLHVHMASLCLMAAHGAEVLRRRAAAVAWPRIRTALVALGLLAGPALIAAHLSDFADALLPNRAAMAEIERMDVDVVLTTYQPYVRNRFDGSNRPKLMNVTLLDDDRLAQLCRAHKVALLSPDWLARRGIGAIDPHQAPALATSEHAAAVERLERAGCG